MLSDISNQFRQLFMGDLVRYRQHISDEESFFAIVTKYEKNQLYKVVFFKKGSFHKTKTSRMHLEAIDIDTERQNS